MSIQTDVIRQIFVIVEQGAEKIVDATFLNRTVHERSSFVELLMKQPSVSTPSGIVSKQDKVEVPADTVAM